ncbi:hypothetical protein [Nocardia sp. NPDC058705]|uniref:hypothetical protein n=1 Tax=Nocardia sp. NPDC058705 TaxID=3346609 RepID=UPI003684F355
MCRRPVLALTVSAAVIAACGTEQSAPSSDLECAAGSGSLAVVAAMRQNSPRPAGGGAGAGGDRGDG